MAYWALGSLLGTLPLGMYTTYYISINGIRSKRNMERMKI